MKTLRLLIISGLLLNLISCKEQKESANYLFGLKISKNSNKLHAETPLSLQLINKKNREVDSIIYHIFNKTFTSTSDSFSIPTQNEKLGQHILRAEIYSNKNSYTIQNSLVLLADQAPVVYTYEELEEYPHDIQAYTQGLEFKDEILYESTGLNGQYSLRNVEGMTGMVLEKIDLGKQYFGEGVTILNDIVYQLTWQENTGYVYDLQTLEQIHT